MFESVLCVKYVSTKTCFVYLSSNHKNLNTGMCIKLAYGDKKVAYFSSSIVRNNVDVESIGINSAYAKLLGIEENTFVNVSQIEQVPVTNSITIQPYSKPDYEVLEMLAQNVQSNLLDQVRVVNSGQNLVIWIGNSITVKVIVDNVQPMSPGILDFLTEVIIKSPEDSHIHKINEQKPKSEENLQYMKDFVQFLSQNSLQNNILNEKLFEVQKDLFYRLIPISELPIQENIPGNIFPFTVFLARNGCKDTFQNNFEFPFYSMTLLNSPYIVKKVHVKLCYLEDIFDDTHDMFIKNNVCNIFVNNTILNFMQCEFGARVVLKKIKNVSAVKEIEVHSKKNYKVNIVEKVKIYLSDDNRLPIILNANFPVEIDDKLFCSFKFLPTLSEYCIVDSEFLRNCSYTLSDEEIRPIEPTFSKSNLDENFCLDIASVRNTYEDIMSVFCIKNKYHKENLIITDEGLKNNYKEFLARSWIKATYYLSDCPHKSKPGMGKSSFLNYIGNTFRNYPYFVNTEILNCKKIKGKTPDSLHKLFTDIFNKLVFCQPSLLILDDLHVLCESCEGEETPNTIYFNRVSEMLYGLFSNFAKYNSIGILVSVESVSKLNKNLYRSRGNHLFKNIFALEDLNKADRILLLKHFFKNHLVAPNTDYIELSIKTDGFVVQDIKDFYQKVIFEAYKESHKEDQIIIRQDHCDIALKKSCALSLQNVKFHSEGAKSFDDIGGLREVKSVLIESLLWPVKYSSIFANAPLRLQSGLLLYGPPGTGKTLLAGAAAKQCSLRLISIKGPELLSKYIGASEQAVRDVFEKAQRAKPCILFFDEFDSLAPRRGHDNTGVTDRVVNQLLTQLDGVEALTGVCVLAATSRPDLLDPALLRPGRLDKQLLCPMPDKSDRLEILQILAKKMDLSDDVNLDEISLKTEGYSGADLQSMLYTAQISSVTALEPNDETKILTSKIDQTCLLEALEKTRPSLTKSEKLKYDIIYTKFRGGNLEDFKAGSKVTLA